MRAGRRRGRRRDHGQAGAPVPRRAARGPRPVRPAARRLQRLGRVREGEGGRGGGGGGGRVKGPAAAGDLDERAAALESLTAIRRAGADVVITYWAKELAPF